MRLLHSLKLLIIWSAIILAGTATSSSIPANQAIESHQKELMEYHQRSLGIIMVSSVVTVAIILYVSIFINNRNKRRYNQLQQQLERNQADKIQQKSELKTILNTHQFIEKENREMQEKLFELWKQAMQICARLYQTTTSYKYLMAIETTKVKKEQAKTPEEISAIHTEINEIFACALQELSEMSTGLTADDLLFCVLNYMKLSSSTIKVCMRVESSQALTQRKYRIKKNLEAPVFAFIFDSSNGKENTN